MILLYIKSMGKKTEKRIVSIVKNTAKKNSSVRRPKQNRLMLSSNWVSCGKKVWLEVINRAT